MVPAPRRGELVRLFGDELRAAKHDLGALVTLESGKILQEGLGEVQEMIDICDFAVGLSRQLYGLTIASERPGHAMRETWHPAGVCGVITAFNFPVAPWCWNAALALVCGDPVIWKPSEKTPLSALATQKIFDRAVARFGDAPAALSQVLIGAAGHRRGAGRAAATSRSSRPPVRRGWGARSRPKVAARFGKCILELGGNNAMIVAPSADLDLAVRAIVFSAVGTAGQRCTSLRRLIVHDDVYDDAGAALEGDLSATRRSAIRCSANTLVGPLIDAAAFDAMQRALAAAQREGGIVSGGERVALGRNPGRLLRASGDRRNAGPDRDRPRRDVRADPLRDAIPTISTQAIALHNDVPQGLASCIFTTDLREAETFLSARGSDCGIANVNIGPSGAEIGGAFGGEKDTGGGRESGCDAWRAYMRRQTSTVNYSHALPLAQGIKFEI